MNTKNAVKDAVEYFKGVWPDNCNYIAIIEGDFRVIPNNYAAWLPLGIKTIFKVQFEQYVKETKMEEPKYKYVDAGVKSVGELYDRIDTDDNGCFVGEEQLCITIDGCSISFESKLEPLSLGEIKQLLSNVTTRQPIPWYEVEGNFPCLVKNIYGDIYLITSYEKGKLISEWFFEDQKECTPLTPAQAAEYGVG